MRFDGYFLLADWLELPNLHGRAFDLARWDLRERLFALGETPPEIFPPRRHAGLILFAYATWLYRLVLFLGIAVLVYTFFIKAVGIGLFLVEIGWFVVAPVWRELQAWRRYWPVLRQRPRARRSAALALAALALLIVPWPTRIGGSGVLRPARQWLIHAPEHALVTAVPVAEGSPVKLGTVLIEMTAPELENRRTAIAARLDRFNWQSTAGVFDSEQRAQWQSLQEQKATAEAEQATLTADASRYVPTAPFDGVLRDLDPDLRPGTWVARGEILGRLVADDTRQVVTYLDAEDVARVAAGDKARFYADGLEGSFLPLRVERIDQDASRVLPEQSYPLSTAARCWCTKKRASSIPSMLSTG